jgi:hypothetical protein
MSVFKKAESWHLDIDRYLNRVIPASPLHKLPTPVSRFLGYRKEQKQDVGNILGAFWSLVGAFCGLAVVAAVFNNTASIQRHAPPAFIASFVSRQVPCCHIPLTCRYRVHRQFSSTTQSAHPSGNRAMLCSVTPSQPSLVLASLSSSSCTPTMSRLSG